MDSRVQTILAGSLNDGSASIPTGLLQTVNGGRPFVPIAYHVDADDGGNDAPVQLDSTDDLICISWIQECDMALSSLAVFQTDEGTQGNITGALYAADGDMKPTGSELADLGTVDSGGSADAWLSMTFTGYQLTRGKAYSIIFGVEASVDVSLSTRRVTTDQGSAFPDSAKTFISTDGGSNWTEATQNTYQVALLNVILNPEWAESGNPVPKLYFGSYLHANIHIPGSSDLVAIPQAGASLACSALTAGTVYFIYAFDSSGLVLEASTTIPIYSSGLRVKTGEITKRLVAVICPENITSTYQGPYDVEDRRNVIAIDNIIEKTLAKPNPYAASTLDSAAPAQWEAWNSNATDWDVECLSSGATPVDMKCSVSVASGNSGIINVGIGVDTKTAIHPRCGHDEARDTDDTFYTYLGLEARLRKTALPLGCHTISPLQWKQTGGTGNFYYFVTGTPPSVASFEGKIWC